MNVQTLEVEILDNAETQIEALTQEQLMMIGGGGAITNSL